MIFHFSRWDIEILLKLGMKTRQRVEDKLALYIQRIVASARQRGVRPFDSEIDRIYEDDAFGKALDH